MQVSMAMDSYVEYEIACVPHMRRVCVCEQCVDFSGRIFFFAEEQLFKIVLFLTGIHLLVVLIEQRNFEFNEGFHRNLHVTRSLQ